MGERHPLVRQLGDPILRTPATQVTVFDQRLQDQVDRMFVVMAEAEGVGLAANQIGSGISLFVFDCDGVRGAVANPRITVLDDTEVLANEGCLSVIGQSYELVRPQAVRVDGQGPDGEPVSYPGEGYLGRCFQHETDHLGGRLYVDLLPRDLRRLALQRSTVVPG